MNTTAPGRSLHPSRKHIVVIGAGLAGLLATRICSEFADHVTLVDRDTLPDRPEPRAGVAQGRHAHGLVAKGYELFEQLFPGLPDDLRARGVVPGDFNSSIDWFFGGQRFAPGESGLISMPATRPTLEFVVREHVGALPNVTVVDRTEVSGLRVEERIVTGLRTYDRRAEAHEVIDADLVVDCSGRGAALCRWMGEHALEPPREETVEIGLAYTSAQFAVAEDPFGDKIATILANTPDKPRGCFFYRSPSDPGVVEVSLTGMLGDHPPTDLEGFLEFAKSLPDPSVHESLKDAELVSGPVKVTYPASKWHHYEECPEMLGGLIPMGDSICSLNPIYAQGMTVAALEAMQLRDSLAQPELALDRYLKACAQIVGQAWSVSASADLAFPDAVGSRTLQVRLANAYIARLHRGATQDSVLSNAFFEVAGLMRAPTSLFRPSILRRVLWPAKSRAGTHTSAKRTSTPTPL